MRPSFRPFAAFAGAIWATARPWRSEDGLTHLGATVAIRWADVGAPGVIPAESAMPAGRAELRRLAVLDLDQLAPVIAAVPAS